MKAVWHFGETADVKGARIACEALLPSVKDDPHLASVRVYFALCARDFGTAEEILNESPNKEIYFTGGIHLVGALSVPRKICTLWIEFLRGNHPTWEQFGAAREQLYRKVEADPSNPFSMTALAFADISLGRNEEGIEEGQRALKLRPISEDAETSPVIATEIAMVYAMANQLDAAFEQLDVLVKVPCALLTYGYLKTCPGWDPLRKDPRFDKLLAELAPRD